MDELVSVLILNWNGGAFIAKCLDSILSQDYPNLETIVVDNGSDDGSPDMIRKNYKSVILLETGQNLGFGAGNNIGITQTKGTCILVLNNDATLHPACISEMKKSLEKDPGFGACASKIYIADPPDTLDAAGITVFPDGLSIGRGRLEPGSLHQKEEEVFFASGCCALYRREMLEDIKVGDEYYDEDFFAYADDTDVGWRARLRGWRCIYAPSALAWHLHSASSGTYSSLKAYLVERNRIWLQVKNFPFPLILYGEFFTFYRYILQTYGAFTGRGASGAFSKTYSRGMLMLILFRAWRDSLRGLPRILAKRREIQKRRSVSTKEMFRLMKLYGIGTKEISFKG
ncbi:MAG: glycosyltransferase family 2 protein [Syntrophobacterales bacterium]|jgi:GT2 family glycosyltransferase|nr:glycosyltransferase family 2 protein [Syntrophobacterales bacterium]